MIKTLRGLAVWAILVVVVVWMYKQVDWKRPALKEGNAPEAGRLNEGQAVEATRDEVAERVIAIVSQQMGVKKSEIGRWVNLTKDLKADELDLVELVMEYEDAFGISISDEDYLKLETVGDVVDYVKKKVLEKKSSAN